MEFPDLGSHCSLPDCRQLDFLPFKCEACGKIFCKEHYSYAKHDCPHVKDRTVPTCPVCGKAVPVMNEDESKDVIVNRHIENECALGRKSSKTKCQVEGCREKEFVKVECDKCHRNFCLRHRHSLDHQCQEYLNSPLYISKPGAAALERANNFFRNTASFFSNKTTTTPQQQQQHTTTPQQQHATTQQRQHISPQLPQITTAASQLQHTTTQQQRITALHVHSLQQPGLSEDEALKKALEESVQQQQQSQQQSQQSQQQSQQQHSQQATDNDEHLARALQEREYLARNPPVSKKQSCSLS